MARTLVKTLSAAILATSLGFGAMATPALAGGQISIGLNAQNADQEKAMRLGLGLYALYQGINGQGGITQNGNNNAAGVAQGDRGNFGVVHQDGNGHDGTIEQAGNNNSCGLFQFGRGTSGRCIQSGGQTGTTFQFGW